MIKLKYVKVLFIILQFVSISLSAQSPNEFITVDSRINFGNYLFCEGDYLRAINEYSFVLQNRTSDSLKFKIGLAYQKLQRYFEAEKYFKLVNPESHLINEANFEYYRSLYLSDYFIKLKGEYYLSSYFNSKYDYDIQKLINLSKLYSEYQVTDSTAFFNPFSEKESIELLKFYTRKLNLQVKSPVLAAILSTVIPGAGKIYTENYGDGITALILTGILTFLSVDNFNADHDFRGWLFAGLATFFYAGNIYGSAASAQIYNANVRISFDNDLKLFLNRNNHFVPKSKWFCE